MKRDEGSVLLWTIGCIVLALSVMTTMTSILYAMSTQRQLQALSESAALAAVQSLDVENFAETGDLSQLHISESGARRIAIQVAHASGLDVTLESLDINGDTASVTLTTNWVDVTGAYRQTLVATSSAQFELNST
jgi:hypothetical protein